MRTDDDDDDDRAGGVGKSSRGKKQRGDKQWVIGVIFGMVLAIVLIFYVVTKGCGKGDHARIGLGGGGRGGNDGDNANANANMRRKNKCFSSHFHCNSLWKYCQCCLLQKTISSVILLSLLMPVLYSKQTASKPVF